AVARDDRAVDEEPEAQRQADVERQLEAQPDEDQRGLAAVRAKEAEAAAEEAAEAQASGSAGVDRDFRTQASSAQDSVRRRASVRWRRKKKPSMAVAASRFPTKIVQPA